MNIPNGVWPTMVTPFKADLQVDYDGLAQLVDWYLRKGANGLFAVCLSSEMYQLSLAERVRIAKFIAERAAGKVPVVAGGHISYSIEEQIEEIKRISETGIAAFVLNTNRLAQASESDETVKRNTETILAKVPDVAFGLYECPVPYKRTLTPELLRWFADTGRFYFMKDTEGVPAHMTAKLDAVRGTQLKVFNAEPATFFKSLEGGASGYSGIMANFHPDLYVELMKLYVEQPLQAANLQNYIGLTFATGRVGYPAGAKYYLQLEGLDILLGGRTKEKKDFSVYMEHEIEQLWHFDQEMRSRLGLAKV